jgi:ribosomal protein S12 methylthiotransferase
MQQHTTVSLISLGCPKNKVDAEVMLGNLMDHGYDIVLDPAEAEIIIVNTCGFITDAKVESVETLLEMAQLKEQGKCRALIASGCLSGRYGEDLWEEMPEVDAFVGVTQYPRMHDIVASVLSGQRTLDCGLDAAVVGGGRRILTTAPHLAYLKIGEGCDNRCSYCAIPAIRGGYRSRPLEQVVAEARELVAGGVKELIVVAQDTTRYGLDLDGRPQLAELLRQLDALPGIEWVRVLYLYPEMLSSELLQTMAELPHVCNYVDLPLQHVDDEVLRRMHRRSNRAQIEDILARVRALPEPFLIRTTMIVGFPGETEAQFQELLDFIEAQPFDLLGAFTYSPEEGTPAAAFPDQVPEEVKQERLDALMLRQQAVSLQQNRRLIGRVERVVLEGWDSEAARYVGRTQYQAPDIDGVTYVVGPEGLPEGTFVQVRLTDSAEYDFFGEIVS